MPHPQTIHRPQHQLPIPKQGVDVHERFFDQALYLIPQAAQGLRGHVLARLFSQPLDQPPVDQSPRWITALRQRFQRYVLLHRLSVHLVPYGTVDLVVGALSHLE